MGGAGDGEGVQGGIGWSQDVEVVIERVDVSEEYKSEEGGGGDRWTRGNPWCCRSIFVFDFLPSTQDGFLSSQTQL